MAGVPPRAPPTTALVTTDHSQLLDTFLMNCNKCSLQPHARRIHPSVCLFLFLQDALSTISTVACVDTLEGDSEGHVRFKTPEEAQAVVNDRSAVAKEHGWTLDLLSGENRFLRDLSVPSKTHHLHYI